MVVFFSVIGIVSFNKTNNDSLNLNYLRIQMKTYFNGQLNMEK